MSARVRVGRYVVAADTNGWMLQEMKVRESGAKAGEHYATTLGYYPTLGAALRSLAEEDLRASDLTTLEQVRERLDALKADLLKGYAA